MHGYSLICVVFIFKTVFCQEAGEPCPGGVCKSFSTCQYAIKLAKFNEEKPDICSWEGSDMIVCCPKEDSLYKTGEGRAYFNATNDGVIRSNAVTCRYDGSLPIVCCNNIEIPPSTEHTDCPVLPKPSVSIKNIAWDKCLEYQRYLHKCVGSDNNGLTREDTCGVPAIKLGPRISGGTTADLKEFPHMAVLGCQNSGSIADADIVWMGGGSLISDRYILTAAHVLHSHEHGPIRYALLGTINKTDIRSGLLYNIIKRIPYYLYQSTQKQYDIALVELHTRVTLSEYIRPACLPVPGLEAKPKMSIAGWGQMGSDRAKTSDILLTADLHFVDGQLCASTLAGQSFKWDNKTMYCLAGENQSSRGYADSCHGDSGGPLMSLISNKILPCTYVVNGVVAFGPTCGHGSGAVYTNVSAFLDWIIGKVWPEEYNKKQKGHTKK